MQSKPFIKEHAWLIVLCISAAAALNIVFIHVMSATLGTLPSWHAAHLAGEAPSPLQFRWLSFFIPGLLMKAGIDIIDSYLYVRFASLALSFWFLARIVRQLTPQPLAPALLVACTALFYAASTQAHIQPAEEPNLLIFSLFLWLVIRGSGIAALAAVMLTGLLIKDTVGFLIPFIFFYRWIGQDMFKAAIRDSAVLSLIFVCGYVGLRMYFGTDRPYLGGFWQFHHNVEFLSARSAKGLMWLLPSLLPMAFLFFHWRKVPVVVRCFVPSVVLFVIAHFMISRIEEFRTYTPLALMMWPGVMAVYSKNERWNQEVR